MKPLEVPFEIIVDTREQRPYAFTGLVGDANQSRRPLQVQTKVATLKTGDYSISGFESQVCVERKSLADLFGTLSGGRERFEREHQRMAELEAAAVVIEADWFELRGAPQEFCHLSPVSVERTSISWMQKYGVPWVFRSSRAAAEEYTFYYLLAFWKRKVGRSGRAF